MSDLIDRQAAIDAINAVFPVDPMKSEYAQGIACGAALAKTYVEQLPSAQPQLDTCPIYGGMCGYPSNLCYECPRHEGAKERPQWWTEGLQPFAQPHWIPVTERLPEEDVEVLITYRYKEGEGDTSHAYIDITTYGQMYFGGNKVGDHKHWRQPFEYFTSNYEVVAWMPLPKAYKGEKE